MRQKECRILFVCAVCAFLLVFPRVSSVPAASAVVLNPITFLSVPAAEAKAAAFRCLSFFCMCQESKSSKCANMAKKSGGL